MSRTDEVAVGIHVGALAQSVVGGMHRMEAPFDTGRLPLGGQGVGIVDVEYTALVVVAGSSSSNGARCPLREAHSLGVIHRDLKPANLFLVEHGDETDFVKILDFGLVKNVSDTKTEDLTQTGLFMGSPKYMAPEQIRGDRVDARTDIYALGIILYEMIAGKVPFDRPNSVNILMAHVNEEPPPLRQMNPNTTVSVAVRGDHRPLHGEGPGQSIQVDGRGPRRAQAHRERGLLDGNGTGSTGRSRSPGVRRARFSPSATTAGHP